MLELAAAWDQIMASKGKGMPELVRELEKLFGEKITDAVLTEADQMRTSPNKGVNSSGTLIASASPATHSEALTPR